MSRRQVAWIVFAFAAAALVAPAAGQEIPPPEKRGDVVPPPTQRPLIDEGEWTVLEDIVAWVNDDVVTLSDLAEAEQELARGLYAQMSGDELESALQEGRQRLLYSLIERRLLLQHAARLYDMSKLRQSMLDQFKDRQGIDGEEQMNALLREQGMTLEELETKLLEYSVPGFVVQAEVTDRISITDEAVEAYFEEHRDELGSPPSLTFREIALRDDGEGEPADVEQRARKVVADARGGVDFAELVASVSESPSSEKGGLIGPIPEPDLAEWLIEPLRTLGVGEVSDPVRTSYGWVVLRLEERQEGQSADLERQRQDIEGLLRSEKFEPALEEFILKSWNRATIEVSTDYVNRLPDEWQRRVLARQ